MSRRIFFILLPAAFCWSCAQLGAPTGGPIDEDPPQVVSCDPPNYSTRFDARKIFITFDEYIVLENVNQELMVSPPMQEKPRVRLRKRTIILQFDESLRENTTYTFNFGDAIKDLHEGNKLQNYEYVFSTGDILDSLSVRGTIKLAEDLSLPDGPVSIMLYEDLRDSVPLTDIPLYVGKSNDSGVFSVNNLRPDVYKVFALKDGNNNLLFDLPSEQIAFLDTTLLLNAEFTRSLLEESGMLPQTDTLAVPQDSTEMAADTLREEGPDLNAVYLDLMLFTEKPGIQYITDYSRDDRRKLQLIFALPVTDSFSYMPLPTGGAGEVEFLEDFSADRDSLTFWMLDSLDYKLDTIALRLNYTVRDTLEKNVTQTDTLFFTYRERTPTGRRGNEEEEEEEKLNLSTIRNGGNLELNRDLSLVADFPVAEVRDPLIGLFHIPDSTEVSVPFQVLPDSLRLNRRWIRADWQPDSKYRLQILPGAVRSIYPPEHDTIDVAFNTREVEYYGQILLSLENVDDIVLVQLTSRDRVVREMVVQQSGQYAFPFLAPGDYGIKFIHDSNGNGKWDTGKYMEKLQPEKVELLPVEITVRSNWDHDVQMELSY